MYCIAFNGPPRSGKDSIANHIHDDFMATIAPTHRHALSLPLRIRAFQLLGIDYRHEIPSMVTHYEQVKDEQNPIFAGHGTMRQAMIHDSEQNLKPIYGQDIFAKMFLMRLGGSIHLPGLSLVADSGFQVETDTLVGAFRPENFLLVRVARPGYDWGDDSRSYVEAPNMLHVSNDSTIEAAVKYVMDVATSGLGWSL